MNPTTEGREIDLMKNYPKSKRDISGRSELKTNQDRYIARKFGKDFFDGSRRHGYGGFTYNSKFWHPVIPEFQRHWGINGRDTILDIGCAKGFMLYDFKKLIPGIRVCGLDISNYAIDNAKNSVKKYLKVGSAIELPYENNSIDISISINTLHNLEQNELAMALLEIERVTKRGSFITVDAYRNNEDKERMIAWNLTAKTVMHVDKWKEFFMDVGYTGDYYWFIP